MTSSPTTITSARKAAETCKTKCVEYIRQNPGTLLVGQPLAYRRWIRTLEKELVIWFDQQYGGWHIKM